MTKMGPDGMSRAIPLLAAALAGLLLSACERASVDGQNLLLICADTVRADAFFHPEIDDALTPWLQDGRQYRQAVTTAPWTLPTIATVFTGLYPVQHGAGSLQSPVANLAEQTPTALNESAVTLAEVLAEHGFETALFSAHPWLKEGFGLDQGFAHRSYRAADQELIAEMLDWLAGRPASRNFTYLHLMETHDLHRTSKPGLERILAELDAPGREFLAANTTSRTCARPGSARCLRNQVYLLGVLRMRQTLAGLMERLAASGRLENTHVVLFSDHGEAFQEHLPEQRRMAPDPRGTRGGGHGHYLYQEVLQVPLVAWGPGQDAGVDDGMASLADLFPTLLAWLDVPYEDSRLPGVVLASAPPEDSEPRNTESASNSRAVFASNIAYGPQSIAVLAGNHKAIYWPDSDQFHIFDLDGDPGERSPLERDDLLLEFSTLAGDYLDLEPYYQSVAPQLDDEHLRDLQAIGYLQGEDEEEDP